MNKNRLKNTDLNLDFETGVTLAQVPDLLGLHDFKLSGEKKSSRFKIRLIKNKGL
jgi:hypothetical protein